MFRYKPMISLLPLAVLVVAFQNCSPTKFSAAPSASAKAAGMDVSDDGTSAPDDSSDDASDDHDGDCVDRVEHHHDHPDQNRTTEEDYRAACAQLPSSKNAIGLADGLNIKNQSGAGRYVAGSFGHVDGNSGHLALSCDQAGGVVTSLNNDSGFTLVCGCDVSEIRNHSGAVVVVDGNVGSISNSSGLVLVGGKITGELVNNSGPVRSGGGRF